MKKKIIKYKKTKYDRQETAKCELHTADISFKQIPKFSYNRGFIADKRNVEQKSVGTLEQ